MNDFYSKMQGVTSKVLKRFGQGGIYYVALTPGIGPKDNPGPSTETPYKLDAAARGVSFKYVNGSTIVTSDLQLTMAVRKDVTPSIEGFVKIDDRQYKIIQVIPKPAAGTPVAYTLIFRN
jgi:hypothetical protein